MNWGGKIYVLAPEFLVAALSVILVCGAWRIRRTGSLKDFGKEDTLPLRALLALYAFDGLKRVKALCFLGLFSYEIYLVHGIPEKMFMHAGMRGMPYIAAVFAVTIPAAWLLWKFDSAVAARLSASGKEGGRQ